MICPITPWHETSIGLPWVVLLAFLRICTNARVFEQFRATGEEIDITLIPGNHDYALACSQSHVDRLAAYNISEIVSRLAFVFFAGTGNAAAVVIGNAIGEGDEERAASIGRSLILLAPVTAAFFGGVVFLLSPVIPNIFAVSPEVKGMITALLRFFSFTIIAKVTNMHIIVGILRGGGDTTYGLFLDVGMLWIFGVTSAFYFGLVLGLPVHLVYLIHNSEEVGKLLFGLPRVLSGRWVNNVTEPSPEIATMEMG